MLPNSKSFILTALDGLSKTDSSITPQKIDAVIKLLEDNDLPSPKDEVLTREQVAKLLKMSTKAVDYHCRRGHFRRIRIGDSKRARGISRLSVEAAIAAK